MIASLPMYNWPEVKEASRAFWYAVRDELAENEVDPPNELTVPDSPWDHWHDDQLLFSQTCGYPYATKLTETVCLLGTPIYDVEGCKGAAYSSAVIARADDGRNALNVMRSLAFNSLDSLSGFRCLKPLVGDPQAHFTDLLQSGSHRASLKMVADGSADCAAIDAVCWDLAKRFEPEAVANLKVIVWTPLLPSLPFVTSTIERSNPRNEDGETLEEATGAASSPWASFGAEHLWWWRWRSKATAR